MIPKNKKIKQVPTPDWRRVVSSFGLGIAAGLTLLISVARLTWHGKFYPGVSVGGVKVAGLTREQAQTKLTEAVSNYQVRLIYNGSKWESEPGMLVVDTEQPLTEAYRYGRRLKIDDYLFLLINKQTSYPLALAGQQEKWDGWIHQISTAVELPPTEPSIELKNNKVEVINGSDGVVIDSAKLAERLADRAANLANDQIEIPVKENNKRLDEQELATLKMRGEKLAADTLILRLDDEKINLSGKELMALLYTGTDSQLADTLKVHEYVRGLAESLDKGPQDAKFEFAEGKVKEFAPGKDGLQVDTDKTTDAVMLAITRLLSNGDKTMTIEIVADRTPPKITTDKVNELGIKERIGRGESYYQHSIPNRIYNVSLASGRINSALIAPGEEVSFNKLVGEVSAATGYRPAYVISGGRTVLGDGGGLCQVSTTMFRAAMNAGLPILERWGHAYRVSYYELNSKPGVDATVYAPGKDLKFKNDTPGSILIQTINDPKNLHLVIEIYGTSDGRVVTMSEPKVWGITPPLPTIYQDDPTLPAGTTKQVDWAAAGAKASFEYKVTRNGETLQEKTFATTYRPWASVFLRGTGQ